MMAFVLVVHIGSYTHIRPPESVYAMVEMKHSMVIIKRGEKSQYAKIKYFTRQMQEDDAFSASCSSSGSINCVCVFV